MKEKKTYQLKSGSSSDEMMIGTNRYTEREERIQENITWMRGLYGIEPQPHQLNGTTNMTPKKKKRKKNKKTTTPK